MNNSWLCVFKVSLGVTQGSVLSPYLFALYVDDIGKLFNARLGTFVVLYGDDILSLAPSVALLQSLLLNSTQLVVEILNFFRLTKLTRIRRSQSS